MSNPVFISYSRSDHHLVVPLLEELSTEGLDPWLDQTSIPVSVPWMDEITKAVRAAELVIAVDSSTWRASPNCQRELRLAEDLDKTILYLDPDTPDEWQGVVRRAYERLGETEMMRAQLLGDSFRWQAAGHQRHHLPTGRLLRVYKAISRTQNAVDDLASAYVTSGVRAARIRWLRGGLATLLTFALQFGFRVSSKLEESLLELDEQRAADLALTSEVSGKLAQNPYWGLEAAISFGREWGSASFTAAESLAVVLGVDLPVAVDNPVGIRPKPAAPLEDGARLSSGSQVAVLTMASNSVEVDGPDGYSRIPVNGAVTALAWSPEGDRLAIADARGVSVVRMPEGRTTAVLRGLDGAVDRLRWDGSSRVVGSAGTIAATWQLQGEVLAESESWFMGLAASPDRSRALAVGREGTYTLIEGKRVGSPVPVPTMARAYAVTWANDAWAISGEDYDGNGTVTVVAKDGTPGRTWPLKGCVPASLAPGQGSTVLLPCPLDFGVKILDLATGEIRDVDASSQPVTAVVDQDGSIITGGHNSEMMRVPPAGQPALARPWSSLCSGGASTLVQSSDRSRLVVGGQGPSGCVTVLPDPTSRSTAHLIVPPGRTAFAFLRAATWTQDGSILVTGWASGEVWFFDADQYVTSVVVTPSGTAIRGVAFNADESELLAVTRAGEILSLPTNVALASFDERLRLAEQRLQIGIEGGLA